MLAIFVLQNHQKTEVGTVNKGSQAELQKCGPIVVTLVSHDWTGKNMCALAILFEKKRILTDIGYARLDMSRIPINFGATNGMVNNGNYLTKVMCAAANEYLKPFRFELVVTDIHMMVRFSLRPIVPVKKLELSEYFETSRTTFAGIDPSFASALDPSTNEAVAA